MAFAWHADIEFDLAKELKGIRSVLYAAFNVVIWGYFGFLLHGVCTGRLDLWS